MCVAGSSACGGLVAVAHASLNEGGRVAGMSAGSVGGGGAAGVGSGVAPSISITARQCAERLRGLCPLALNGVFSCTFMVQNARDAGLRMGRSLGSWRAPY